MDRFNPDTSNDTPKTVEEQTPHSGVFYDEKPVKDFDNTTLPEAVDQGLITVPEDVSPLIETSPSDVPPIVPPTHTTEQANSQPEQNGNKRRNKVIAWVAGIALALGGGGVAVERAINANADNTTGEDPKGNGQVEEEPGTGEEKPPVVEEEKTIEQLIDETKIEAGLSAEEYAKAFFEKRFASWLNSGSNRSYWEERQAASDEVQKEAVDTATAEASTAQFANAIFMPGWNKDPKLTEVVHNIENIHKGVLKDWNYAFDFDGSNGTPEWEEGMVVESVEDITPTDATPGTRTLRVAGYQTNNGAETARSSNNPNVNNNGKPWVFTVTTTVVENTEYVSGWGE